ncbi:MAG: type II secretion system GspH family protein [Planctomycetaceae bacterium]|nr:type II secretion system GspH family protein [Planctomycetaceae bacterium]
METKRKSGFTIVELLTVMAIIAILMGLLLPAMQAVRKLAKDVSQKAQFKTIEAALEAYAGENGTYPESSVSPTIVTKATVGAHKLAEALVGRDMQGFDPKSSWDADTDRLGTANTEIYANREAPQSSEQVEVDASLKRRQEVYLKIQDVEAYQVNQLFNNCGVVYPGSLDSIGTVSSTYYSAPVLTDTYRAKKVTLPNGTNLLAGTPILYYKADTRPDSAIIAANGQETAFPDTQKATNRGTDDLALTPSIDAIADYIYDVNDNDDLVKLYQMMKPTAANVHYFDSQHEEQVIVRGTSQTVNGLWLFYDTITNEKMAQPTPYNRNSYILISAGYDGIYGTKDDIYNFEK